MDSSSEGSTDEEEVLRLFDKEAKVIVQSETLPKKSADRYMQNYNAYKNWKEKNKNSLSTSEENNLIVYFKDLKKRLSPLTLWSAWSMLKKTLNTNDDIQINNFLNLKSMIKQNAKGHRPKKSFILTWEQIKKFIDEAPDSEYLAVKVVLIFGICGCLRCLELTNMKVGDGEDLNGRKPIFPRDHLVISMTDATIDSQEETINAHEETVNPENSTINPKEANVNTEQETHEFESALIDLNWSDFEDDFTETDPKQTSIPTVVPTGFTTANQKPLFVPQKTQNQLIMNNNNNNNKNNKYKLPFTAKSGIKLSFLNHQTTSKPPLIKRKRHTENLNNQNNNNLDFTTKDHAFKFENCTFNNCVFNLTKCDCDKENIS
ncbi:Protein of unknown function [Cotesia congregata]|uniref:Uncharacterized protein n=1 Tax=Cotesia congregata TaxID=51543 RepID=A0A8J2MX24_COTCN|nr:Protein of unknown function [Cotesia congregata]